MEFLLLVTCVAVVAYTFKSRNEQRRIALLGSHLGKYQIEKLMETLTDGYLRALGEADPERRGFIWRQLEASELKLCEQFTSFAAAFARVGEADARVSTLAVSFPYADKLFPRRTFDMRKALAVHAQGILQAVENKAGRTPKNKAFTLLAELFLMQHTCHWFCKSRTVASARVLVRHKTPYYQLLESVAPQTRLAYAALVGK